LTFYLKLKAPNSGTFNISPRIRDWKERGERWNDTLQTTLRGLGRYLAAKRVASCQKEYRKASGKLYRASCNSLLCFFCSQRRQLKLVRRWGLAACSLEKPLFITLTGRSVRYLSGTRELLLEQFRQVRRLRPFRENCTGGFYCTEFEYVAHRDMFHPHIHALVDGDLSESWLSRTWKEYTSAFVVDVQRIQRNQARSKLYYMAKSASSSLDPRAVSEVYSELTGCALFHTFGAAYYKRPLCWDCRKDRPQIGFGESCSHPFD
jgi:hypothetical protein